MIRSNLHFLLRCDWSLLIIPNITSIEQPCGLRVGYYGKVGVFILSLFPAFTPWPHLTNVARLGYKRTRLYLIDLQVMSSSQVVGLHSSLGAVFIATMLSTVWVYT